MHPVSLFPFVLCSFGLPVSWSSFWCGGVCLFLLCVRCVTSRCMNLGWSRCAWYVLRGGRILLCFVLLSLQCPHCAFPDGAPVSFVSLAVSCWFFPNLVLPGVWIEFWIRLCLTDPTDGISSLFVFHWFCPRNLVVGQLAVSYTHLTLPTKRIV